MAERKTSTPLPAGALRRGGLPAMAAATLALAGAFGPIPATAQPAMVPPLVRALRAGRLVTIPGGAVRATFRRWVQLRLVRPAIRATPKSRSDTPALPTVGRPRDSCRAAIRGSGDCTARAKLSRAEPLFAASGSVPEILEPLSVALLGLPTADADHI